MNRTDDSEPLAKEWLEREYGASNVRQCNDDPPDFEVDVEGRKVGVEVRRLNSTATKNSKTVGEEEVFHPIADKVEKAIKKFNNEKWDKKDRRCLYVAIGGVDCSENHPIDKKMTIPKIVQLLGNAVDAFEAGTSPVESKFFDSHLKEPMLTIIHSVNIPQGEEHKLGLRLGVPPSSDRGVWVVDNLTKHISRCMEDKAEKVSKKVDSYDEWWLVLNDRIDYGADSKDQYEVKQSIKKIEPWKRIIILNRFNDEVWEI